jgi:hypothetical protein
MTTEEITKITGLSAEEMKEKIAEVKDYIFRVNLQIRKKNVLRNAGINPEKTGDLSDNTTKEITFAVSAITEKQWFKNVLINVPVKPSLNQGHALAYFDKEFKGIQCDEIPDNYFQGDILFIATDGRMKPGVCRHYLVTPKDFGEKIIANVEIMTKVNLLTGEEVTVINIWPNREAIKPELRMAFDVAVVGKEGEYKISQKPSHCIRFDKIVPYVKPVSEKIAAN